MLDETKNDPLLTTAETARMIDKSPRTVEGLRCIGGGPPFLKIGRSVRYRKSSVEQWLASCERTSTADGGGR